MDNKDQQIEEMQCLIDVLRQQLHAAIDAACSGAAKNRLLEAKVLQLSETQAK